MIDDEEDQFKYISLGIIITVQVIMLFLYKLYFYEILDKK